MKKKRLLALLLSAVLTISAAPLTAFAAGFVFLTPGSGPKVSGGTYVLMNIPYSDFYGSEKVVDAIASATLKGKARNVNVNGSSYHESEKSVTTEGIAGVTFPVRTTPEVLDALRERGAKLVTDADAITYEMNARGRVSTVTLSGERALQEAPSYSYYVLPEAPEAYKKLTLDAKGKPVFGATVFTASVRRAFAELTVGGGHAEIEIALDGLEIEPADVSGVVIVADGVRYALHHVVNVWRGTEIGWNTSDLDLRGKTVTNVRYYLRDGAVKDFIVNVRIPDYGYVLMNIPYADFYEAELADGSAAVDAVASATKNKPRTMGLAGGSYHENADGTDISGVIYPVLVEDMASLARYRQVTDKSSVTITVTNRGQTSTTTYTGKDALFESPSYSYYVLKDKPAKYKMYSEGRFSAIGGRATTVNGVEAKVTYDARHANVEISLTGTTGIETGAQISGVILTDSEGKTYGLRHVKNVWRATEIGWDYDDLDLLGKTIVNVRYITQTAVIDFPVSISLKK